MDNNISPRPRENSLWIWIIVIVVVIAIAGYVFWVWQRSSSTQKPSSQTASQSQQTRKIVALGSSITQANNLSPDKIGDNPEYSFSLGTKINSLFSYLSGSGEKLEPVNLSSSGATISEIASTQAQNVASYSPKYITLDPGADIVAGTSVSKYKEALQSLIDKIKGADTKILIANYPNFVSMRSASFSSCSENKVGVKLENLSDNNLKQFNSAIQEVAQTNGLILVDIYSKLGPQDISEYDCLHPNLEGQKKIAAAFISAIK